MKKVLLAACLLLSLAAFACSMPKSSDNSAPATSAKTLTTGAIPDQDAEKIQRQNTKLAKYLEAELKVPVVFKPVTDTPAVIAAFKSGDLDLVWFSGLTGVQARLQVPGAEAIAQRNIDANSHSVFIANKKSGIEPIADQKGLVAFKGKSFTFGSETSTSGRVMPQLYLSQAGIEFKDFKGQPGFSKSHDATLDLVQAGTYDAGVLNEQVWINRLQEGKADPTKVTLVWRSPAYYDSHWVINPSVSDRFGKDFSKKVQAALLKLDPKVPEQKEILDLFGAEKFISTQNANYEPIEKVDRQIGKTK